MRLFSRRRPGFRHPGCSSGDMEDPRLEDSALGRGVNAFSFQSDDDRVESWVVSASLIDRSSHQRQKMEPLVFPTSCTWKRDEIDWLVPPSIRLDAFREHACRRPIIDPSFCIDGRQRLERSHRLAHPPSHLRHEAREPECFFVRRCQRQILASNRLVALRQRTHKVE